MVNRTLFNLAIALGLFGGASLLGQPAAALTIAFDDLTDTSFGFGGTPIANGYQGLNWVNWNVLNTTDAQSIFGPSGATPGTVSLPNIAYNSDGGEAIFSSTTPFEFDSAYLTAVWNSGMTVTVTGLLNGTQEDQTRLSPSATVATLYTFDWSGVNEVDILPIGGTPCLTTCGYSGSGTQLALDNLIITPSTVVTPEPSTLAIVAAGLAGLGVVRRCRRSAWRSVGKT